MNIFNEKDKLQMNINYSSENDKNELIKKYKYLIDDFAKKYNMNWMPYVCKLCKQEVINCL